MHEPKFTISGLRGVWEDNLTPEIVARYARAFAIFLQERGAKHILIGRDARHSGPLIKDIVIETLTRAGISVTDGGILPTPTVLFLVRTVPFDGAVIITASHNPREYNGIKFVTSHARFTNAEEVAEIHSLLGKNPDTRQLGIVTHDETLGVRHVDHVYENVDHALIASKKFRVVIDPINSAGAILGPLLLKKLGCDVTVINGTPDGNFAHMPEPLPEHLTSLGEKVREVGAAIGFAQDPDADRLVFADEHGNVVFEEYTLSLAVKAVLKKTPGNIVTNLSTTNTNEDLVHAVGYTNFRTAVGEAHVVEGIITHQAVIGGEGGGGVIYPKINLCRDSLTGMALILESLAQEDTPVSTIIASLPKYVFVKKKFPLSKDVASLIEDVISRFPQGVANKSDGLRIDFDDRSWVQIRGSNTEPIVRVYAEAKTETRAHELVTTVTDILDI